MRQQSRGFQRLLCDLYVIYVFCSTWVMLNTEKRRAVRIPDEMRVKLYAYTPQPLRWAF